MQVLKSGLTILACATLAACGGGGGGTTDTTGGTNGGATTTTMYTLSASNYQSVASEASLGGLGTVLVARNNAFASFLSNFPVTNGQKSITCSGGGTQTVQFTTDTGNLNYPDKGDVIDVTSNNCVKTTTDSSGNTISFTYSGKLTFTINNVTGAIGTTAYNIDATTTFGNLSATSSSSSTTANGSIRVVGIRTSGTVGTDTITSSDYTQTVTTSGASSTYSLKNLSAKVTYATTGATTTIDGTMTSNLFGDQGVTLSTPTAFTQAWSNGSLVVPTAGVLTATGANNGTVKLTAMSTGSVQIDLDGNADGAVDASTTKAWSAL